MADINKDNIDSILKILLGANSQIDINYLGITQFQDKNFENDFLKDNEKSGKFQYLFSNLMMLAGYISYLTYVYIVFYHSMLMNICILNFSLSFIILILSRYLNNKVSATQIDRLLIFINYVNVIFKIYFIIFELQIKKEEYNPEFLRTLFYSSLSTFLYLLIKMESYIYDYIFYIGLNSITVIACQIYSSSNYHYYFELILGSMLGLFFFYIRKLWDFNKRNIYSERNKKEILVEFIKVFKKKP